MVSGEEAKAVEESSEAASTATKSMIGSNLVVNIALAGSLNQVWGIVNGLQVVAHLPLFKVKSPGNVNTFNELFLEISNFDIVDTSTVNTKLIYWPEMDPISLNFQNAGFDSPLVIPQLGTLFYLFVGMICLTFLWLLLLLLAKIAPKTSFLSNKVRRFLIWNGSIRFFMEGYLDFALMALINVRYLDWESP